MSDTAWASPQQTHETEATQATFLVALVASVAAEKIDAELKKAPGG